MSAGSHRKLTVRHEPLGKEHPSVIFYGECAYGMCCQCFNGDAYVMVWMASSLQMNILFTISLIYNQLVTSNTLYFYIIYKLIFSMIVVTTHAVVKTLLHDSS